MHDGRFVIHLIGGGLISDNYPKNMNTIEGDPYTACWGLWSNPSQQSIPIEYSIDRTLAGYLFYPEPEWSKYGYRPPENCPLLGAWRDPGGTVFIFLLDGSSPNPKDPLRKLLLYATGSKAMVEEVERSIAAIKKSLAKAEKRELILENATRRLEGEQKSQSMERLMKLIGLFAVIINAFSLYLRKLAVPDIPNAEVLAVYQFLLIAVHFSALVLLLTITTVGIIYACRYGFLLIRRLWS